MENCSNEKRFHALGLMSGTSLDGLDIALCSFVMKSGMVDSFQILQADTIGYESDMMQALQQAMNLTESELMQLSKSYGRWMGEAVTSFMNHNRIAHVDIIASHGHTVFHQPDKGITLQIGDGKELANATQLPVVNDFRSQDVQLGGQGAPLVPIGDKQLFAEFNQCLNIGGFSNISMEIEGQRFAWDICPVNTVGNDLAKRMGMEYDRNGKAAANGQMIPLLFQKLNDLAYYKQQPPKSLGREWVSENINPIVECFLEHHPVPDVLRTWTEHVALRISEYLQGDVLVTGGGAKNTFLMQRIRELSGAQILVPDEKLVDFKESLIFAFMGLLRFRNEVNVLASVTGAVRNHSSGQVILPQE